MDGIRYSDSEETTTDELSGSDVEDSEVEVFALSSGDNVASDSDGGDASSNAGGGASDLDQDVEDEGQSWGRKKSQFYNANEESSSGDELEEEEAKVLQQRLQAGMKQMDYSSHWFHEDKEPSTAIHDVVNQSEPSVLEEVSSLIKSLASHFEWLLDLGLPMARRCGREQLLSVQGHQYLYGRIHSTFCYGISVLHYLSLQTSVAGCSAITALAELLHQMSLLDEDFKKVMESAPSTPIVKEEKLVETARRLSISKDPLQYYKDIQKNKSRKRKEQVQTMRQKISEEDWKENGKRAITFEMARNKGLTPSRKKEQRNPRVKHRNKFRRALIKRKSQVRPVVPELIKYGGEETGIRSRLARSVAIK